MILGAVCDDFTGASDLGNTLAKAGARTLQYVGCPEDAAVGDADAAVISLKTRSIRPEDAVAQSLDACRWLIANGVEQVIFKYCSTFDSTREGNIGPVAEALLEELQTPYALVCPAFPANGRTVYLGHLFVGDRLLSESGMERHPLTPMTDPDIRRWLAYQTRAKVGHVTLADIRGELDAALEREHRRGARLIVADAVADDDLNILGRAAKGHRLVTGGSAIAMGLPGNFGITPGDRADQRFRGAKGPALVISGSCSTATRAQVDVYLKSGRPALQVKAADVADRGAALQRATHFIQEHKEEAPLIFSTAEPEAVAADQERFGREDLAAAYEGFFADITKRAIAEGFQRLVSAGGETSGAVASALGRTAFLIGPEIATGVPALATTSEPHLALVLKSGNFGTPDFFERAVSSLAEQA